MNLERLKITGIFEGLASLMVNPAPQCVDAHYSVVDKITTS